MKVNSITHGIKSICKTEYEAINKGYQILHDCYLVSSIKALNKTQFGREMLSKSVRMPVKGGEGAAYEVEFFGFKRSNKFIINKSGNYKNVYWRKEFDIIGAIEYATDKVIKRHPYMKSLFSRLFSPASKRIEYNKASLFLEKLTAEKPVQIGDNGIIPLKWRKNKAINLMRKISETPEEKHSFVTATLIDGCERGIADNHYYMLANIDMKNFTVTLGNPRNPDELKVLPFKTYFKNFRSIVGYFEETVK